MTTIQFRDGPLLREDAILLALALEKRGHQVSVRNGKLSVTDASKLTASDRDAIGRVRAHLMALATYCKEGHEPR